jgi:hypothetical protein
MGPVSGSVRATPEHVLEYSAFLESMGHAFDCIIFFADEPLRDVLKFVLESDR